MGGGGRASTIQGWDYQGIFLDPRTQDQNSYQPSQSPQTILKANGEQTDRYPHLHKHTFQVGSIATEQSQSDRSGNHNNLNIFLTNLSFSLCFVGNYLHINSGDPLRLITFSAVGNQKQSNEHCSFSDLLKLTKVRL